jgi:hypothetical protein
MALHQRVAIIDTLLEEAAHKRTALTYALHAKARVEQGKEATHSAPLTDEEEGLQDEQDLWQQAELDLTELRKSLCRTCAVRTATRGKLVVLRDPAGAAEPPSPFL